MEFPRDSEIVYGADMCNRRLRGVKVNPIYQEKDTSGTSEVDPSIPVGEIQIDMYESLPRKRRILKYSPDSILLSSTNKDGHRVIEWKYPTESNKLQNNSPKKCAHSNTCVSAPDCVCGKNVNAQQGDLLTQTTSGSHLWSNSPISKDMIRNNLNNNSNNDYDSITASDDNDSNGVKCTSEDGNIRECSPIQEQDEDSNSSSEFNKTTSEKAIQSSKETNGIPSSADAIVAYATVENTNPRNIYSVNDFSGELSDMEFSLKHSNKFLNDLDYITSRSIPVYPIDVLNNNHGTVPDQMVNIIHNTIQSSDDIASIKALQQSLSSSNSFDQSPHKIEKTIDKNGNGLISSISGCACGGKPSLKCSCGRLALQKLLKQKYSFTKHRNFKGVDSPTLDNEGYNNSNSKCKENKKLTKDDQNNRNEESVLTSSSDKNLVDSSSIGNSEDAIIDVDLGEDTNVSRSILISKRRGSKIRECRAIKFAAGTIFNETKSKTKYAKERRRPVDVVSDNIKLDNFPNGNECYDNPVFLYDEDIPDSVFYDETSFTTLANDNGYSGEVDDTNKSNNINEISLKALHDGSVILKPEDLNVPGYLDDYIRTFNNNNKAPPVSIEALGGMTVADLADIEVAKDDYDYKSRRRKNNAYGYYDEGSAFLRKEQRIKNIKICAIVFAVFALICTAIGLGIHYGGGANSTALSGTVGPQATDQQSLLERTKSAQGFGGFGAGVF